MEKIKTILDRKPLSSDYINSKQDFSKVLSSVQKVKPPLYKSGWFYGAVGLATIAIVVSVISFGGDQPSLDPDTSVVQASISNSGTTINHVDKVEPTLIAQADTPDQEVITPVSTLKEREVEPVKPKQVVNEQPETPEQVNVEVEEEAARRVVQEEKENKPEVKNKLPHIAGVYNGQITFEQFCDPNGLQVNEDIQIVSYSIRYTSCQGEFAARIGGHRIPPQICEQIIECGGGVDVFINNIVGQNIHTGERHSFFSLNVQPTK